MTTSPQLVSLKFRLALLFSILLIVPVGYWVRFYSNTPEWLSDALGAVAYEIFWILFVVLLLPQAVLARVALFVCLLTCGLELLQLWQPPWLQAIRATLPGRLVLGNTFDWADFPAYGVGSWLGWLWVRSLRP